jgi:hypothetical protein
MRMLKGKNITEKREAMQHRMTPTFPAVAQQCKVSALKALGMQTARSEEQEEGAGAERVRDGRCEHCDCDVRLYDELYPVRA